MLKNFSQKYHMILSKEFPEFLNKYLSIPILVRLKNVGLLCGTDWTPFFSNNIFYSRFEHSVGVALIIWNFTKDKAQTIAGLLHDVSTPAFSHVQDFRKGDSLTQTETEKDNFSILKSSAELLECLKQDGLSLEQVSDYHKYPIADNEVPALSADRLEYMFPSGIALKGNWSLKKSFSLREVKKIYNDIVICKNESNIIELGFKTKSIAELYTKRITDIGLFLQKNEDKMALQFLAEILNMAIDLNVLSEKDLFERSEKQIIDFLDNLVKENPHAKLKDMSPDKNSIEKLCIYFKTFRTFKKIVRSDKPLENHYCINLKVKKRYINPLVMTKEKCNGFFISRRITELSEKAKKQIDFFLNFADSEFACVKLLEN